MSNFDIEAIKEMDDFELDDMYSEESLTQIIKELSGEEVIADKGDLIYILRDLISDRDGF